MPIIRSAKKKLRQDKKREKQNLLIKRTVKRTIRNFKKNPTEKLLTKVFSILDQASKKKIFHANKVARLKSRLSRLLNQKKVAPTKKANLSSPRKEKSSV